MLCWLLSTLKYLCIFLQVRDSISTQCKLKALKKNLSLGQETRELNSEHSVFSSSLHSSVTEGLVDQFLPKLKLVHHLVGSAWIVSKRSQSGRVRQVSSGRCSILQKEPPAHRAFSAPAAYFPYSLSGMTSLQFPGCSLRTGNLGEAVALCCSENTGKHFSVPGEVQVRVSLLCSLPSEARLACGTMWTSRNIPFAQLHLHPWRSSTIQTWWWRLLRPQRSRGCCQGAGGLRLCVPPSDTVRESSAGQGLCCWAISCPVTRGDEQVPLRAQWFPVSWARTQHPAASSHTALLQITKGFKIIVQGQPFLRKK